MGGNLSVANQHAQPLDLTIHARSEMVKVIFALLHSINMGYKKKYGEPLWSPELFKARKFLSGSSLHFFDVESISDEDFINHKQSVGDIDTMVDSTKEESLRDYLTGITNKKISGATLVGFQRGNEQFSALWKLDALKSANVQIDFEFVAYKNNIPTDWAKYSHSSSWNDMQQGVKGVFHKFLIQSLASLTNRDFILRKLRGRGKARADQDTPHNDNMYSFSVSSKEGGGLRVKYENVRDDSGNPVIIDGLPVLRERPTTGYEKDIGKIFTSLLGAKRMAKVNNDNLWSFSGLLNTMQSVLSPVEKSKVLNNFIEKLFGKTAQGLYKNDPDKDITEKKQALSLACKTLDISIPSNLEQLIGAYKQSYKMSTNIGDQRETDQPSSDIVKSMAKNALKESAHTRQSVKHLYNPASPNTEIKPADFIRFCKEISDNGGILPGTMNLKCDGAGIRFGKDEDGKAFFMTSNVNEPKYIENYGDFTKYGQDTNQDESRLNFTKQYDEAMKIILSSDFIKKIPNDSVVHAEMLFMPMRRQSDSDTSTFVHIPYDNAMLGKLMTVIPYAVKSYRTGANLPNADSIIKTITQFSTNDVKIMDNRVQPEHIDLTNIVNHVLDNTETILTALKQKNSSASKQSAIKLLSGAKKAISDAIANGNMTGADKLGSNREGYVIDMPSGMSVKITSDLMKKSLNEWKQHQKKPSDDSKRHKPAIVTIGSFVGHKGHQQLIDQVVNLAKKLEGDPYVYVSPKTSRDDPIPVNIKLKTLRTLYPELSSNILMWQEDGTPMKKIEKELVLPSESPYNKVILVIGTDRYESMDKWMKSLEKRMHDPDAIAKYGGTQDQVEFETVHSPRYADGGGTGVSYTALRKIANDPSLSFDEKLAQWKTAFSADLPETWIKKLLELTTSMSKDKTINEYVNRFRKLWETASSDDQKSQIIDAIKQLKHEYNISEPEIADVSDAEDIEHDFLDDPESQSILAFARQHYPESKTTQGAFLRYVRNALKHAEQDDTRQDDEIDKISGRVQKLEKTIGTESPPTDAE